MAEQRFRKPHVGSSSLSRGSKFMDKKKKIRLGLSFYNNYKMAWSPRSPLKFVPEWIQKKIIDVWNPFACSIWGHSCLCREKPGVLPVCCDCGKPVQPTPEQEESVINEW